MNVFRYLVLFVALGIATLSLYPAFLDSALVGGFVGVAVCLWIVGCFAGTVEASRRRVAWVFMWCGVLWAAQFLGVWADGPGPPLSAVATVAFWVLGAWTSFKYPEGVASKRSETVFVWLFSFYMASSTFLAFATSRPEWLGLQDSAWWPAPLENRVVHNWNTTLWVYADLLAAAVFVVLMVKRLSRMRPLDRVEAGMLVTGVCGIAVFGAVHSASGTWYSPDVARMLPLAVAASFVPAALALGLYRARREALRLTTEMHRLLVASTGGFPAIEVALQNVLQDPHVRLRLISESGNHKCARPTHFILGSLRMANGDLMAQVEGPRDLARHVRTVESLLSAATLAAAFEQLRGQQARHHEKLVIDASASERRRLEQDLHDDLQQRLLALRLRLKIAEESAGPGVQKALLTVNAEIAAALESVREMSHSGRPPELVRLGLAGALKALADRTPLRIMLSVAIPVLPLATEEVVYFVTCEAVNNVLKHSQADHIWIEVSASDDAVVVVIQDDGTGIGRTPHGFGLTGITRRVSDAGGEITIRGEGGTQLSLRLPITS